MPNLSITQTYATGNILTKTDLDNIGTSLATFMNSTKLDSTNVQTGGLIGTNLANATITATQLASSVAGSGLTGGAGTALAVNVDNVTMQVTANQVAIKSITRPNLPAVGQQVSSSSGPTNVTSTSFVDITNLTVTITTTGRPVILAILSDGTGSNAAIASVSGAGITSSCGSALIFRLLRGATNIANSYISNNATMPGSTGPSIGTDVPPSFFHIDAPTAGTYTYKLQGKVDASGNTGQVLNCVLFAYEL